MGRETQSEAVAVELTGPGRGGVATVGLRGADALRLLNRCFAAARPDRPIEIGQVRYGEWRGAETEDAERGRAAESVVVTVVDLRTVEIHCHGGRAAVAAILADLRAAGASWGSWADWLALQETPMLEAEAELVLARTETRRTAAIALDQARGALRRQIEAWLQLDESPSDWSLLQSQLGQLIERWEIGRHLVEPWRVVLAGAPNVGKSSLLNALVGYRRAITFDAPGTTRDVIGAETVLDGWPIHLSDTAGLRLSDEGIERKGIEYAERTIREADLVVWVTDARDPASLPAAASDLPKRMLLVRNKADLRETEATDARSPSDGAAAAEAIFTVALRADGVSSETTVPGDAKHTASGLQWLSRRIIESLIGLAPEPGTPVPVSRRQVERLREAREAPGLPEAKRVLKHLLGERVPAERDDG